MECDRAFSTGIRSALAEVPSAVLSKAGLEGAWGVVADGFLIPGKQTGSVTLLDLTKGLESVGPSETRKVRGEAYFEVFGASGKVLRNSKCSVFQSPAKL